MTKGNLLVLSVGLCAVCAGGILSLDMPARHFGKGPDLNVEYIKALLQLIVVVVLGTALRLVADGYQREKSKKDERQKFKEALLTQLVDAYSEVKQLRRVLRARGRTPNSEGEYKYLVKHYDKTMERLSRKRLLIERIAEQIEASRKVFTNKAEIGKHINVMEAYLKRIDTEWQEKFPRISSTDVITSQEFPRLNEFVEPSANITQRAVHTEFVQPYHDALELLRADIERGGESASRTVTQPLTTQ